MTTTLHLSEGLTPTVHLQSTKASLGTDVSPCGSAGTSTMEGAGECRV